MKKNYLRVEIEKILASDANPLFDYEIVCKRLCRIYTISGWETFYNRVRYHVTKMEEEGLLYVHRCTNQGTVFMLRSQSKQQNETMGDIPF